MTTWLIDKSALVRLAVSPDAATWATRIQRGLVRVSTLTRLEIGFSARSATELRQSTTRPPLASMPIERLTVTATSPSWIGRCSRTDCHKGSMDGVPFLPDRMDGSSRCKDSPARRDDPDFGVRHPLIDSGNWDDWPNIRGTRPADGD